MPSKLDLLRTVSSVATSLAIEKVRKPRLSTVDDIPMSGVDLTTEWLTTVLCADTPGAEVVAWSSPGGSSGTSERAALRVEYNAAGTRAYINVNDLLERHLQKPGPQGPERVDVGGAPEPVAALVRARIEQTPSAQRPLYAARDDGAGRHQRDAPSQRPLQDRGAERVVG